MNIGPLRLLSQIKPVHYIEKNIKKIGKSLLAVTATTAAATLTYSGPALANTLTNRDLNLHNTITTEYQEPSYQESSCQNITRGHISDCIIPQGDVSDELFAESLVKEFKLSDPVVNSVLARTENAYATNQILPTEGYLTRAYVFEQLTQAHNQAIKNGLNNEEWNSLIASSTEENLGLNFALLRNNLQEFINSIKDKNLPLIIFASTHFKHFTHC